MQERGTSTTRNKQRILDITRNHPMISRAEISRRTGLSMPTVTKITDHFIEMGLLRECGKGESSGGKPPALLKFIPDLYFCIGIDVGSTSVTGILSDCAAQIVFKYTVPTASGDAEEILRQLGGVVEQILRECGVGRDKILGIGVGMPGLIESGTGMVVFSPDLFLENVDIKGYLAARFQMPVLIDNMSHAMAVGEHCFGVCREVNHFLCLNVGYGIGGAVFFNGMLYHGSTGFSGEIGHIIVNPLGPQCLCGNRGCLEAVASARAIVRDAREMLTRQEGSIILELAGGDLERINARHVFDAARLGDRLALEVTSNAVMYLGMGVASITNMLDLEMVVLEGGVSRNGDIFVEPLVEAWQKYRMKHSGVNTRLVVSEFGENAAAIGASALVFNLLMERGCNPKRMGRDASAAPVMA